MEKLFDYFHDHLKFLHAKWFTVVISALIYLNPIALMPQVITVFIENDLSAISISMWVIFALIQIAFVFVGIKTKNSATFLAMLISLIESITIITMVLIKT